MIKRLLIALVCFTASFAAFAQGNTGDIEGDVTDPKGQPVAFANVVLYNGSVKVAGASTDAAGHYKIKGVAVGVYTLKVSNVSFETSTVTNVKVSGNVISFQNVGLKEKGALTGVIVRSTPPVVDKGKTSQQTTLDEKQLKRLPSRDLNSAIQVAEGANGNGETTTLRGSRGGQQVIIDGVKVRTGMNLPLQAVQEITILTGGIPADLGDATGGYQIVNTKGIVPEWFGSVEGNTSQYLDAYGHHLVAATVGGPIAYKKIVDAETGKITKEAVGGLLLSAEGNYKVDPRPSFNGWYTLKPDVRESIMNDPYRFVDGGVTQNAAYLTQDDFILNKRRRNAQQLNINMVAKLDFRLGKNSILTFGGNGFYTHGKDVAASGGGAPESGQTFNWQNYGVNRNYGYNVFGRFTQRFDNNEDGKKNSTVKNGSLTLQVDYSKNFGENFDQRNRQNIFNYGYVGSFSVQREATYLRGTDATTGLDAWLLNGYRNVMVDYTPSNINPELSTYTSDVYRLSSTPAGFYDDFNNLIQYQALRNGDQPSDIYGIFSAPGAYYNSIGKTSNSQFRVVGNGQFDIKNHGIKVGFEFEQRQDMSYALAPGSLWTRGRLLVNNHLSQLDFTNPMPVYNDMGVFMDTIRYDYLFADTAQAYFDKSLRTALGKDVNAKEILQFDAVDPSQLNLQMFSPDELLNNGSPLVGYYGYDAYGNKVRGGTSLEDFFNAKSDQGYFNRHIAPFQPVYIAGYIMDKFSFRDLIFNVGVRVDRYDANQRVLKDPYSLYETRTAGEISNVQHPQNIGSDYVVYVNSNAVDDANKQVLGYRSGDRWFNAQGAEINDPTVLRGNNLVPQPWLVNSGESVGSGNFNVAGSFKDYKPQVNVQPRIAFSFPISDRSIFMAHYDVLIQRPTAGLNRLDPFNYFYWANPTYNSASRIFNNPDLRPEKTIDYSLGFQQAVGEFSALKITAYYREVRDQIQVSRISEAYPATYFTYKNIDFGTTKGITLSYNRIRNKNLGFNASYTMQFAEGTGANTTSSFNLVSQGQPNLRILQPLSLDQRHFFNVFFDFGFNEGEGPTIKRKGGKTGVNGKAFTAPLENAGFSLTFTGGSGLPFSRSQQVASTVASTPFGVQPLQGSINGSRLPWQFNIDLRVYKQFTFKYGGKKVEGKKDLATRRNGNVEIYLLVNNLFNFKNVIGVYRFTGNANDDGFLTSEQTQTYLASIFPSPASFRDMYGMAVNSPYNFSQPRRIRLGATLNF
ncbi:MAG: TonB-dependent receptor [Bacteroidia bacterium]|nr:TonB-dependent receptor [Bacteroidia bacterium]